MSQARALITVATLAFISASAAGPAPATLAAEAVSVSARNGDLRLSAVTAPRAGVVGGRIALGATLRTKSRRVAGRKLQFALSKDRKLDRRDRRLKARPRVTARRKNRVTAEGSAKIPATTAPGTYYVLGCARAKGSRPGGNCASSKGIRLLELGRARPLTVTARPDPSRSASAAIDATGGVVKAIGADGATYELTIPANALLSAEEIVVTPLAGMEGLPLDGRLAAGVLLEPEGLSFNRAVSLSITPPGGARPTLVPFTGAGTGENVHLYPARLSGQAAVFELTHFTVAGLGSGSTPGFDRLGNVVPTGRAAQMQQFIQRSLTDERGTPLGETEPDSRVTRELLLAALYVWGNEWSGPSPGRGSAAPPLMRALSARTWRGSAR